MRALLLTGLLAAPLCAAAATLDVAWWRDGRVQATQLHDGDPPPRPFDGARDVPLGSLWKLFVYVYAVDTRTPMPDYRCGGRDPEEVYCCTAGKTIARDAALAQSCGPFFAPHRLRIGAAPWRAYWSGRLGAEPAGELAWLASPANLTPERTVRLASLLRALASVPAESRAVAEGALLRVVLDGRGADTVRWFGSGLRVKTFSWHETPQRGGAAQRLGGAAGWLADGTPVWFAGTGTSAGIFRQWAPQLAAALPASLPTAPARDSGCVEVEFFARYPVRAVRGPAGPAASGPLHGRHVVQFENGNSLALQGNGDMLLARDDAGRPHVRGRFGVNEYVARVVDREGGTQEPEAAKALAVAARTYLQQNAQRAAGCQRIADSSATQRVSPNPASTAALAVARWTDQLVIEGATVRYHRDVPGPDTLAWTQAVAQARQGRRFDEVLAAAWPRGALGIAGNSGTRCNRLANNEAWLARALPRWERVLRAEAGYEQPAQLPAVCALAVGAPYSEQSRNRIFMRPLATREDRITLAHEYLHIGLRLHPRGQDEDYVERLARRLADMNPETL
ncbi:uncharacterized protein YfaQ (DUF2300 family) [Pseudoduganella flava]|uniref:DUF2300 domain-containing protein n=2 Tax=Pseudoduganella flava TaxID=871742 RepID=A0A562PIM9_9BURK|nr:DUF2300 domain-containing protein [Pseudoduganella flava]TWI44267.1 uncharacterized protein YfaQ (DUF2300 family) [Pseudoduganella flava]